MSKLLSLYGLKFHPFRPDVPIEALYTTPAVDSFLRRVELGIADGGFAMLTGDPGTGKSIALRLLAERLRALPDVLVGTVEHPQSRTMDFYRELGDLFGVPLAAHNRWAGFKALRSRWAEHIGSTRCRPVLIVDEAQETLTTVFSELRILASKELDSKQLLCVVFAGDARLPERLRSAELLPLGSRIRRRLTPRLRLARRAARLPRPPPRRRRQSLPHDQRAPRHPRRSRRRQLPRAHESRRRAARRRRRPRARPPRREALPRGLRRRPRSPRPRRQRESDDPRRARPPLRRPRAPRRRPRSNTLSPRSTSPSPSNTRRSTRLPSTARRRRSVAPDSSPEQLAASAAISTSTATPSISRLPNPSPPKRRSDRRVPRSS